MREQNARNKWEMGKWNMGHERKTCLYIYIYIYVAVFFFGGGEGETQKMGRCADGMIPPPRFVVLGGGHNCVSCFVPPVC